MWNNLIKIKKNILLSKWQMYTTNLKHQTFILSCIKLFYSK